MQKERQSNFELMRIVSMILIIIWHIIIHATIIENTTGLMKLVINFIYILISVHVNSFVLLTGYFQYKKDKVSFKKILSIFNMRWFYKALIVIIFVSLGLSEIDKITFIREILPLYSNDYWFINCYLLLCFLFPYLNILIKNLDQKQHRHLIFLLFFLFSIMALLSSNTLVSNHGSTLINFVMLYCIGSYLGKYPIDENLHFKNYSHNKKQLIFLCLFIFFGFLNFLMFNLTNVLSSFQNSYATELANMFNKFQTSFSNPLIILSSIFYFLYFRTLHIKSKVINWISPIVLGIYLIHENHHIYHFFYQFIGFNSIENMTSSLLPIKIFILAILIFTACAIIEWLRQRIFNFIASLSPVRKISNAVKRYVKNF